MPVMQGVDAGLLSKSGLEVGSSDFALGFGTRSVGLRLQVQGYAEKSLT